jgi:hypothetical protein
MRPPRLRAVLVIVLTLGVAACSGRSESDGAVRNGP